MNKKFNIDHHSICISIIKRLFILMLFAGISLSTVGCSQNEYKSDIISNNFKALFISNLEVNYLTAEDFSDYRGVETLVVGDKDTDLRDINEFLYLADSKEISPETYFFNLDVESLSDISGYENKLASLKDFCASHPETGFFINCVTPGYEYFCDMSDEKFSEQAEKYVRFISAFDTFGNVSVYFPGSEKWLLTNSSNFEEKKSYNREVALKVYLYTFCDGAFKTDSKDIWEKFDQIRTLSASAKEMESLFPNLKKNHIVFIGDSIFGNFTGSYSIPGVVSDLTSATVYNISKGGATATTIPDGPTSVKDLVDAFIAKDPGKMPEYSPAPDEMSRFVENEPSKNLIFILHFGINDYLTVSPVSGSGSEDGSYSEGMKSAINKLKNAYPDSRICILTPSPISVFNFGTDVFDENGTTLKSYCNEAFLLAEELDLTVIDINEELSYLATDGYLTDGIHPNENGLSIIGQTIAVNLN
ncbi:MAG: SGNH/GDSL hydrolase family protein [Acetatifactor sp.]|nr:SGNH/GDSL hydrolase family protein [Acetatifactor sp.]